MRTHLDQTRQRIPYVPQLHHGNDLPVIVGLDDSLDALFTDDRQVAHPDATDLAHADDPTYDQCPRCTHLWPLDDMARDRNGDNICPDCIFS